MEAVKDIIKDIRFVNTSKNLLNQLRAGELTISEFLRECAFWALRDGFDELRPLQYPTPPNRAAELENMPISQRLKLDWFKLYAEFPEIKSYYEQRLFVKNKNKANLDWLEEVRRYIPQEDNILQQKIDNRILEFRAFMDDLTLHAEKAKEIFNAEEQ